MGELTQWGRMLKRGDTGDIEDWRVGHRLLVARSILRNQGIEPTFQEHEADCDRHPDRLRNVVHAYRDRVFCACGADRAWASWPEWVTDDVFNATMRLADLLQTERGKHNRAEAYRLKREREAAITK